MDYGKVNGAPLRGSFFASSPAKAGSGDLAAARAVLAAAGGDRDAVVMTSGRDVFVMSGSKELTAESTLLRRGAPMQLDVVTKATWTRSGDVQTVEGTLLYANCKHACEVAGPSQLAAPATPAGRVKPGADAKTVAAIGTVLVAADGAGFRKVGTGRVSAAQAAAKARGNDRDDLVVLAGNNDVYVASASAIGRADEQDFVPGTPIAIVAPGGKELTGSIVYADREGQHKTLDDRYQGYMQARAARFAKASQRFDAAVAKRDENELAAAIAEERTLRAEEPPTFPQVPATYPAPAAAATPSAGPAAASPTVVVVQQGNDGLAGAATGFAVGAAAGKITAGTASYLAGRILQH